MALIGRLDENSMHGHSEGFTKMMIMIMISESDEWMLLPFQYLALDRVI